jgi:hypothetical protein
LQLSWPSKASLPTISSPGSTPKPTLMLPKGSDANRLLLSGMALARPNALLPKGSTPAVGVLMAAVYPTGDKFCARTGVAAPHTNNTAAAVKDKVARRGAEIFGLASIGFICG